MEPQKKYRTPDGLPVDIAYFTITSEHLATRSKSLPKRELKVLLIQRDPKSEAFPSHWAFPGGFSHEHESLDEAARRELKEETNVGDESIFMEQLRTYYTPGRDPRGWIPSVVYVALLHERCFANIQAADDAAEARLFTIEEALQLPLAFDHREILEDAIQWVRTKVLTTTVAREFLDEEFTINELYHLISTVVPEFEEDKTNFKRKLIGTQTRQGLLEEAVDRNGEPKFSDEYSQRKAQLYRFTDYQPKLSIYDSSL